MKPASVLLLACCAMWAPSSNAQDGVGLCGVNDAACLEAQIERQCTHRTDSSVESCTDWIHSIQRRVRADDRLAKRHIALAYFSIAMFHSKGAEEKLRHRSSARAIYAELVQQDARDVEALLGLATLAEDEHQKIELLRKIASIAPGSMEATLLADALEKRGGENDALEAAAILDGHYRQLPKGSAWPVAARAMRLYEIAGASDRSRYLRDRMRDELDAASLVSELQRIPETSSVRAGQILGAMCDTTVDAVLGGNACLEGMGEISRTLTRLSDRVDARRYAEVLATQVFNIATFSGHDRVRQDPDWQRRISSVFLELEAASIESPMVLVSRAKVELDPVQKGHFLDRAAQLAPDDRATLQLLADENMTLRRRTDAMALLRRLRQLQATTEEQRHEIDLKIEALQRSEQWRRESGAAR